MRSIGIKVNPPRKSCEDPLCPFHGHLKLRGRVLRGRVLSSKPRDAIVVEREYLHYVPKFMRYEKRRNKIHAHLPPCLEITEGDNVTLAECRPIAKSISFVAIERVGG